MDRSGWLVLAAVAIVTAAFYYLALTYGPAGVLALAAALLAMKRRI